MYASRCLHYTTGVNAKTATTHATTTTHINAATRQATVLDPPISPLAEAPLEAAVITAVWDLNPGIRYDHPSPGEEVVVAGQRGILYIMPSWDDVEACSEVGGQGAVVFGTVRGLEAAIKAPHTAAVRCVCTSTTDTQVSQQGVDTVADVQRELRVALQLGAHRRGEPHPNLLPLAGTLPLSARFPAGAAFMPRLWMDMCGMST